MFRKFLGQIFGFQTRKQFLPRSGSSINNERIFIDGSHFTNMRQCSEIDFYTTGECNGRLKRIKDRRQFQGNGVGSVQFGHLLQKLATFAKNATKKWRQKGLGIKWT